MRHTCSLWVELKLKSQIILIRCMNAVFVNVYKRTPADNRAGLRLHTKVILLGDINVDFITNNRIRDCLAIFNLSNVIKEPTRISVNTSTLIDPIIVIDACQVFDSGSITVDNSISDHMVTYVSIKTKTSFDESYVREV